MDGFRGMAGFLDKADSCGKEDSPCPGKAGGLGDNLELGGAVGALAGRLPVADVVLAPVPGLVLEPA